MDLTSPATLASSETTTPGRATRCQVLTTGRRGVNRCESEAIDPAGEILLCLKHAARAIELLGRQPGITITLTSPTGA